MSFPVERLRRLRRTPALRRLVRETELNASDLVLPLFVAEGLGEPRPIATLPGVRQETLATVVGQVERAVELGVPACILFGVPAVKDAVGSGAGAEDGIVQQALRAIRGAVGDAIVCMADTCLDEFTDHGHCGLLTEAGVVDNDPTIAAYGRIAVSQAAAGADIVAPSGMMDGQVAAIRAALDGAGFAEVAIMAYAAKFASVFYGPFRDAAGSTPRFGDRRSHQLDVANGREALREVALDVDEGADLILMKPALTALDVVAGARRAFPHPLGAYVVSGEYAMLRLAAAAGAFDEAAAMLEAHVAVKRAGADFILTYFAREVAEGPNP